MSCSSKLFILSAAAGATLFAHGAQAQYADAADAIYVGGPVITMNERQPRAEAVAIRNGRILAVGNRRSIEDNHKGGQTKVVDLKGRALLPGFIDGHSHYFSSLSIANQVNVYAPPAGPGTDPDSIVAELVKFRDAKKIAPGVVIQAYGYDENVMPAGNQLTRDHLDKAFPDNPVLVGHVSMHGAVLNSAAFTKWNISADTKTPPGGVIVRRPGSNEPLGLIMETAYMPIFASLPRPTAEQEVEWTRAGQLLYAQHGVTTAHEGATHAAELALMQRAAAKGAHLIDVVAYPFITELDQVLKVNPVSTFGSYNNRLKIGGVKITIDGSPQGRTAYFTKPYLLGGPAGEKNWRGEPTFPEDTVKELVKKVYDMRVPLNLHANGDAAIDMFLRAHEFAAAGDLRRARNTTVIHSQFVRTDQLEKFVRYRVRPSFYTLHTYYFADTHTANRGATQTRTISPMHTAMKMGLRPSNHTDFVVAPLDQMFMLWSAVNRISRDGKLIGADERVTAMDGLKAMTIFGAEQHGEAATKGSLEPGKLADMVILDRSPLAVAPMDIKDIKVVETIKDGVTVFAR